MRRSFPAIRFGLMVGIGGGAPSAQHYIRLGDVVVSSPTGRTGGVIHYEFGKTVQDKKFERTGSLSPPPPVLLNALQKLSTLHERRGHQIAETVSQMVNTNARLKRYQHPDPDSDVSTSRPLSTLMPNGHAWTSVGLEMIESSWTSVELEMIE